MTDDEAEEIAKDADFDIVADGFPAQPFLVPIRLSPYEVEALRGDW